VGQGPRLGARMSTRHKTKRLSRRRAVDKEAIREHVRRECSEWGVFPPGLQAELFMIEMRKK
jgi:hypothetical protein